MAVKLEDKVVKLLKDENTYKALATVSKTGEVHVTYKNSITVDENGNIIVFELLDSSQTQKNLTYAIWFDKKVAVNVVDKDGSSFQIKGIPYRDIVTGPYFEKKYREFHAEHPDNDLSSIWVIPPLEVREETYTVRRTQERTDYPVIGHIDRDYINA